ncbi:hypothetical protein RYX36_031438 [Vicia faba]
MKSIVKDKTMEFGKRIGFKKIWLLIFTKKTALLLHQMAPKIEFQSHLSHAKFQRIAVFCSCFLFTVHTIPLTYSLIKLESRQSSSSNVNHVVHFSVQSSSQISVADHLKS